tara:strand:- start:1 stop:420 length:420 start_codon:yes stop_codon:yes gene_type:complete
MMTRIESQVGTSVQQNTQHYLMEIVAFQNCISRESWDFVKNEITFLICNGNKMQIEYSKVGKCYIINSCRTNNNDFTIEFKTYSTPNSDEKIKFIESCKNKAYYNSENIPKEYVQSITKTFDNLTKSCHICFIDTHVSN